MEIFHINECFGYYNSTTSLVTSLQKFSKYKIYNALNAIGYLPAFGVISAIIRIALCIKASFKKKTDFSEGMHRDFLITQVIRSVGEFIGVGFLFVGPDIYFTYKRETNQLNKSESDRPIFF